MLLSGLIPRQMCAEDDSKCLEFGIGFTNVVERATRGSANLTRKEIEEGILNVPMQREGGVSVSVLCVDGAN